MERENLDALIAELYYIHDYSQKDISQILHISRPTVSRYLEAAKEKRIIEVIVHSPVLRNNELSQAVRSLFGLRYCCVVKVAHPNLDPYQKCAQAAANFLQQILRDDMVMCVSTGRLIMTFTEYLEQRNYQNLQVVQMNGCLRTGNPSEDGIEIAMSIAKRMGATYYNIYAPIYVDSETLRGFYMQDSQVATAMQKIHTADVAIMGIGSIGKESNLYRIGWMTEEDVERLRASGCRAQIMGRMVRMDGTEILSKGKYPIAPPLHELQHINWCIGLCVGKAKTEAVYTALVNRYVNTLFLDEELAQSLLNFQRNVAG